MFPSGHLPPARKGSLLLRSLLAAVALVSGTFSGAEPLRTGPSLFFETWRMEDGLPQNHATAIAQTRDGYLWLGSYNGLARFDGVRFTVFDSINTTGLRSSRIISLYVDAHDVLWIGHETGELSRFADGHFEPVTLPPTWPREPIDGIGEDAQQDLWILCRSGQTLRLREGQVIASNPEMTSPPVPLLVRDAQGTLWRLSNGKLSAIGTGPLAAKLATLSNGEFIACVGASRTGGLWMAGSDRVRKWRPDLPETVWGKVPWGKSSVTTMIEGRSGQLWVGTLDQGLFVLSPDGSFEHFTHTNGFQHAWVRCLFEDHEGTIWAGTGGGGLSAVRERRVTMVKAPDDWQRRTLLSVSAGANDTLWVGTEGGGVYRVRDGTFTHFGEREGLQNLFVWSVLEDATGGVWAGTWGAGLFQHGGGGFSPASAPLNEPLRMLALHNGRDGALWVGTQQGLVRLKDGRREKFVQHFVQPDVRCIAETADGTIWFGMAGGGLGRWRNGESTQFRMTNGLPGDYVWSLLAEEDGTLWIGTFGGGLCRWRDGQFSAIGTREGLPNNTISHIADDGHGFLWMGSFAGILRASKLDLHRCADGLTQSVPVFAYGKADGLTTLECSGGSQPSGCRTADGRLWFATSRGLAVITPANLRTNPLAPPVVIEDLMVDLSQASTFRVTNSADARRKMSGKEKKPAQAFDYYRIPPGKQRFEFRFTALSFVASDRVRFKYRLDGLDNDWVDGGTKRTANYSFLTPGDYTFRVIACNNDGVWNESGAALALTVLPYFWQTWWFQAVAALAAAGAVGGVVRGFTRRRYRRKLEKVEHQRAIEKERARIAKDIHDDLGASLTRITLLSQSARGELDRPEQAGADLDQIYATARELTKAMDEIVWAVSPRHDTLDSLVSYLGGFAQDFLSAANVRCRLDVPLRLPALPLDPETRHNLFLALKEAVHNVVRHAAATEAHIVFNLEPSGFTLAIHDDGRGFDPARHPVRGNPAASADTARLASGNGLLNMHKRLEEIGGQCVVESAAGRGTVVQFVMPMKRADGIRDAESR